MHKLAVILFFACQIASAQSSGEDAVNSASRKSYGEFLAYEDSTSQARMFMAGLQYLRTTNYASFRTGGMHLSLGFNVARFITKKHILGLYVDFKGIKGFTAQNFSTEFKSDFNAHFRTSYSTQEDSARAYLLKEHINSSGIYGNYLGDVGIMFSVFPQKFGGILVVVKKGYRTYVIHNIYGNPYIGNGEKENAYIDLSNNYALELSVKPYAFFKNSFINPDTSNDDFILKFLTLTFYYEQTNFRSATIENLPFTRIVGSDFIDKYGKTATYGFKIGLTIY